MRPADDEAAASKAGDTEAPQYRLVWDLPVRVVHWTLVLAFIGAYVTDRAGVKYFKYHTWCGYAVIVLASFRILWGVVGTRHARFSNFLRGPVATVRYAVSVLKGAGPAQVGHNPLGAWMVVIVLIALLAQAIAGLFGNDEIFNFGPLYGYVSDARSLALTSFHRRSFYWLLGLVVLHVLAVAAHWVLKKQNLVRPMVTGYKPAPEVPPELAIRGSRLPLAAAILIALAAALAWVVVHAPSPSGPGSFD